LEQQHQKAAHWYFANERPVEALEHRFTVHALDEAATQLVLHIDEALVAATDLLEQLGPQDKMQYRVTAFVEICSLFYTDR
jgi:hypothetical protein